MSFVPDHKEFDWRLIEKPGWITNGYAAWDLSAGIQVKWVAKRKSCSKTLERIAKLKKRTKSDIATWQELIGSSHDPAGLKFLEGCSQGHKLTRTVLGTEAGYGGFGRFYLYGEEGNRKAMLIDDGVGGADVSYCFWSDTNSKGVMVMSPGPRVQDDWICHADASQGRG